MDKDIEIPLDKKILLAMLIGSLVFVGLGLFFYFNPNHFESTRAFNDTFIQIIGMVSIAFFGLAFFLIAKKILNDKMGLIIDSKGITDNSHGMSVGLVEWEDIAGIRTVNVERNKFIIIDLHDSDKYINSATNKFSKMAMLANNKMYGSPITIACNALKIKFSEAEKLINKEFNKRKSN